MYSKVTLTSGYICGFNGWQLIKMKWIVLMSSLQVYCEL